MRWLHLHWKDFSTSTFTFEKRASVEEQRAQKYNRFSRGRQIAYMIYEHFRVELMQQYKDSQIFAIYALQNDDVTSSKWNTTDVILDGLYKSKLQDSVQLQTMLALYEQETVRNNGQPSLHKIENLCKTSCCSIDENSKLQGPKRNSGERTSIQETKRKESLHWEESGRHAVSVMTLASGNSDGGQRRIGRSSSPAPTSAREKKTFKTFGQQSWKLYVIISRMLSLQVWDRIHTWQ